MDDYLKCNVCPEELHEGKYCRCEPRNIRIAKESRSRGESWAQKNKKEVNEGNKHE